MPYSWCYFDLVKNASKDKTFHSCQIPLALVELIIKASTRENDTVQILFGGSGSELVLCKSLERNFISSEIQKPYYDMIMDRLGNGGVIRDDYKLDCAKRGKQNASLQGWLVMESHRLPGAGPCPAARDWRGAERPGAERRDGAIA